MENHDIMAVWGSPGLAWEVSSTAVSVVPRNINWPRRQKGSMPLPRWAAVMCLFCCLADDRK